MSYTPWMALVLVPIGYLLYLTEHKRSWAWKGLALIPLGFSALLMTLGVANIGPFALLLAGVTLAWGVALWQEKYIAAALMEP